MVRAYETLIGEGYLEARSASATFVCRELPDRCTGVADGTTVTDHVRDATRRAAPAARVGALLDTLSSADDKFWPLEDWSDVKFNLPLQPSVDTAPVLTRCRPILRVGTSDLSLAEVGRATMSLRCKKLTT